MHAFPMELVFPWMSGVTARLLLRCNGLDLKDQSGLWCSGLDFGMPNGTICIFAQVAWDNIEATLGSGGFG